jgi:hypothetical protein
MPIIRRFSKNEIFRFSGLFYRVEETERITQKYDNEGAYFLPGAFEYELKILQPTAGQFVHIEKIGINGYIQIQLLFPKRTRRGAIQGVQYLDFRIACHQNPHEFIFFVPENVPPFLDINNPLTYPILSQVLFKGYLYVITPLGSERPKDPITHEYLPFTDISAYTPFQKSGGA